MTAPHEGEGTVRWALLPLEGQGQHKLAQPLWKASWYCINSLKTFISFDLIIALLGNYHKEIRDAYQSIIYDNEKFKTLLSNIGRLVK